MPSIVQVPPQVGAAVPAPVAPAGGFGKIAEFFRSKSGGVAQTPASSPESGEFPYAAFISYAHSDNKEVGRKWGEWLQETIRDFRIPLSQVGKSTPVGTVPREIRPVFLDRLELTAGGSLDPRLREALAGSQFLLVLCSPNSSRSDWVGQEIQTFREMHGWQNIIPVVISGEVTTKDAPANAIRPELWELMPTENDEDDGEGETVPQADRLPLYIDFRVRKTQPGRKEEFEPGWTDAKYYDYELKKEGRVAGQYRRMLVSEYAREHKNHKYKMLAAILGLRPRDLEDDSNAEEIRRQRTMIIQALTFAGIALVLAVTAFMYYRKANVARAEAERSLLMIGDAHEGTSRLLSDVLVDLKSKLDPAGQQGALDGARRIVNEYFDENELKGDDDDSRHMRSVVLNSRGYLALRMGDFAAAEKFYKEALTIREDLLRRDPAKPMNQHNLAVSFDNLGDLQVTQAQAARKQGKEGHDEFVEALAHYRKSLGLVQALAARSDATPQWRHDLAVSYFKVGDALFEGGDKEAALAELTAGFPVAERVAAGDPEYAKWQAHLGLYCLEIGRLRALSGQEAEAKAMLQRGKAIFEKLLEQKRLSPQHAEWLRRIKAILLDLAD